eukprot:5775532-Amphidinium_carterae.1
MAGNVYVSSYLAVQMLLCEYAYDYLAGVLTDWENHKVMLRSQEHHVELFHMCVRAGYARCCVLQHIAWIVIDIAQEHEFCSCIVQGHAEHYNSLIWKQAIFQSVNNYYPFLHLIMQQSTRHSVYCWGGRWTGISTGRHGASRVIRSSCSSSKFVSHFPDDDESLRAFAFGRKGACAKPLARTLNPASSKSSRSMSSLLTRSRLTEPSQGGLQERPIGIAAMCVCEVWTLLHPVLSLGHVLLFGAAAPIVVLLCFFVFAVNLRASAFLITNFTKRHRAQSSEKKILRTNTVQDTTK